MTTATKHIASLAIVHYCKGSVIHEVFVQDNYEALIKKVTSWFVEYAGTKFKIKTKEKKGFVETTVSHESFEKPAVFLAKAGTDSIRRILFYCLHNAFVNEMPLIENLREEGVLYGPERFDIIEKVIKS